MDQNRGQKFRNVDYIFALNYIKFLLEEQGEKVQNFQNKVLNRIVCCRQKLMEWKVVSEDKCIYHGDIPTLFLNFFLVQ